MKIVAIELYAIAIPFLRPYKLSKLYGTLHQAEAVILKLRTDEGLVGWGEADPMNPFTTETPATVMAVLRDQIAPHLLGQDPTHRARLTARLEQAVSGNRMAHGAVDMALFDLLGKVHQVPVHALLGGRVHDALPLLGPIGSGTPDEDAAAMEGLLAEGYRTVMIKMGALGIDAEIERMIAAKRRFGDCLTLIVDANQGWGFKEACRFVAGIRGNEPALIEQPVGRYDIEGLRHLRTHTTCLLSADESLVSLQDARNLAETRAADVFSIKVSKNGGLARSQTIARVAEAFGIRCLMNSMLEFGITQAASLQLGCTLNNLLDCGHAYMSVLRLADDITDFRENIVDAVAQIPSAPGLGVRVDEARLERYTRRRIVLE